MNCQEKKSVGKRWNMRHSFMSDVLISCTYPAKYRVTYNKSISTHGNSKYPYGSIVKKTKYLCGIHLQMHKKIKEIIIEKIIN